MTKPQRGKQCIRHAYESIVTVVSFSPLPVHYQSPVTSHVTIYRVSSVTVAGCLFPVIHQFV